MDTYGWRHIYSLGISIILCLLIITGLQAAHANSSIAELEVPPVKLLVTGLTSPEAQIIISVDGSQQASQAANKNGTFEIEIANLDPGVVQIDIDSTDKNGTKSAKITRNVAMQLQQTSVINVFLPPTIVAIPETTLYSGEPITFSGYAPPNAIVNIVIGNSLKVLRTITNKSGRYEKILPASALGVGFYSYRVQAEKNNTTSEPDTIDRQFSILPPITQPYTPSTDVPTRQHTPTTSLDQQPILIQTSTATTAPSIPSFDVSVDGLRALIRGQSDPGTEVLIYDEGRLIGVVIADNNNGEWMFYFQAHKEQHLLQAQACQQENCSDISTATSVDFEFILGACILEMRLESYRLLASVDEPAEIIATSEFAQLPLTASIAWGDQTSSQISSIEDQTIQAQYIYNQPGLYNGSIIINDGNNCSTQAYFTVQVIDQGVVNTLNAWRSISLISLGSFITLLAVVALRKL